MNTFFPKLNSLTPIIFFFGVISMFSCSPLKVADSNLVDQAPEGFNNPDMVLMIQKKTNGIGQKRQNKNIAFSFNKYYSGKYEMASSEEICANLKYADKKIYRYIFHEDIIEAPSGSVINYSISYHLYDRATEKKIELNVNSNMRLEAIDIVAKKLNNYTSSRKIGPSLAY